MDALWRDRNQITHHHPRPLESVVAACADKAALEHSQAQVVASLRVCQLCLSLDWSPTPVKWFKINTDAAFVDDRGSCVVVVRNSDGEVLFAAVRQLWGHHATQAEILGLQEAVSWAASLRISQVIFESDSESTIRMILSPLEAADWHSGVAINSIHGARKDWPKWKFKFARRHANSTAHALAQWAFHSHWDGSFCFSHLNFVSSNCSSVFPPNNDSEC